MPAPVPVRKAQASPSGSPTLAAIFLLFGAASLGFGGWSYLRERAFLAHAIHAKGRVTFVHEEYDRKAGFTYKPDFEFADAAGATWTNTGVTDTHPYDVGDSVPLVYNPDNPAQSQVASFWAAWEVAVIFGPIGMFCLVTGILVVLPSLAALRAANVGDKPPPP